MCIRDSSYTNEGYVSIFERFGQQYVIAQTVVSPQRKTNNYFGAKVALKRFGDLYRAFVSATDLETVSNQGKIFL